MNLLGKALDRIADWVVGEAPIIPEQQRVHQYERLMRALDERGWRDTP
jgi:hypothetical protein